MLVCSVVTAPVARLQRACVADAGLAGASDDVVACALAIDAPDLVHVATSGGAASRGESLGAGTPLVSPHAAATQLRFANDSLCLRHAIRGLADSSLMRLGVRLQI